MAMGRGLMSMMDTVFGGPGDKKKSSKSTTTVNTPKPSPAPENKKSSMPLIDAELKKAGVDN